MEFVFDRSKCVACGACVLACIDNKDLHHSCPLRELVRKESGTFPNVTAESITISCFHCKDAECVKKCPTGAMHYEPEFNTVQIDREKCINCHTCVAACPYGQIKINENGKIVKCDFCIDVLRKGKNPICVDACQTRCLNYVANGNLKNLDAETSATKKEKISSRPGAKKMDINEFLGKTNDLQPQFYLKGDE